MSDFLLSQSKLLASSYRHFLKVDLIQHSSEKDLSEKLYNADFVVLSHDGAEDPCFNYANKMAQELFEFSWDEFHGMPSKLSAEPDLREEREKMLEIATKNGFYEGYKGVRISKSGKRFFIDKCVIFNLIDENGKKVGQAATFSHWNFL